MFARQQIELGKIDPAGSFHQRSEGFPEFRLQRNQILQVFASRRIGLRMNHATAFAFALTVEITGSRASSG